MVIIKELEEIEFITNNEELEEYMMNNEELDEIDFITNNEEMEEYLMNNEELEEMEFSMNNEEMEEMDLNPCFSETITHVGESDVPTRNKKNLTNEQRLDIFHFLLKESKKGRPQKRSVPMAAQLFSTSESTVKRIWKRGKDCEAKKLPFDVSSRKPTRVRPKPKKVDFSKIMEIPLRRRTTIRSIAEALNMPKSTVHRYVKKGAIKKHTNAIKPAFTVDTKKARLEFCFGMLELIPYKDNMMTNPMYDVIHIDEKWFFMTKATENYYLHPEETEPYRTCQSKRFIKKVMFLAAVARPRFDEFGNEVFNRKIDITRARLINKLLPSIREKWPNYNGETIYIQQDNAKPHVKVDDEEFLKEAEKEGFDIRLRFQPSQSPDMNVLDLGFFRSIQSLQHKEAPTTVGELLSAVDKAFNELSAQTLNDVFLSLQLCMVEVLKLRGGNNYKLQHIGKKKLARIGELPTQIEVDKNLVKDATNYLSCLRHFCKDESIAGEIHGNNIIM
ncbi:uncharacterized protein LOC113334612 [Papaver somniferum]|uniref:uncharacterized protein LOC113334612 n=1 Tax=Papaver somniferum TaxID=3469 RepID=UPI000E6F57CD|nr:uncharacterized protein LOC113334612 [Papaver somniferum]